jgi:hypothetical protein
MRRLTHCLAVLAAILLAGWLAAGCSSGAKSAIANLSPSRNASSSAGPTAPPTTAPPTTAPPTTAPPTTAPPTTAPPTTAPPTTAPPTTAPTTPTPSATSAPAAQPSSSPAASASSSSLLWLWILLGAVILIGLIVWIVHASGRRSKAAASWQSRIIDAYAKGSALHDAMSVADTPGALVAADAGARWSDIQLRADDLAQNLYALREAAPDDDVRARVADVLASLQAVRSAMDAERAPGGAGPGQNEVARQRLMSFETALRALRASGQRAP